MIRTQSVKRPLLILAGAFTLALLANWAVLSLFDQKSAYRAAHSLVGILFLMAYAAALPGGKMVAGRPVRFFLLCLIPCYLGTVWPDLDIRLLGIGGHRNPLFHSALIYLPLWLLARRANPLVKTAAAGFGIGLASHLFWDVLDHADVRWIPGGSLDRAWLGVNGLLALAPPAGETRRKTTADEEEAALQS